MDAQVLLSQGARKAYVFSSVRFSCLITHVLSCVNGLRSLRSTLFMKSVFVTLAIAFIASYSQVGAATYKTDNFIVQAGDSNFARQVGDAAELYRSELAVLWLGETLPRWSNPCVIKVKTGADLAAGGETVFSFANGEVYDWKMRVQGSNERILDSVLPHEVTHTIIATYLRAPVPRWLDEGMATAVEAKVERSHYRTMLATFLHTKRGIAFNDMVSMKEYPKDLTPFYSQSFSICEYLIMIGGHRRLARFAKEGNETDDWNGALKKFYQCDSLGALQIEWLEWVRAWDLANQPDILPETRKLPELEFSGQQETLVARNTAVSSGGWGNGMKNWGRSKTDSSNEETVARGQSDDSRQGRFLQGIIQPFSPKDTRTMENNKRRDWQSTAHERPKSVEQNNVPATLTTSNGTVWRSGESLLANGAGSASNAGITSSSAPPVYYRPSQNSSYSSPSGLLRR